MTQKSPTERLKVYSDLVGDLQAIEADAAAILDELATTREDMKTLAVCLGITLPEEVAS